MEKILDSAIKSLTLGRIQRDAYDELVKSFDECFKYMRKNGWKSDPYFKKNFAKLSRRQGLLDAWMLLTQLATFAAGFAAGKGRKKIRREDVISTQQWGCDSWPGCPEMRIDGSLRSLSTLIEWYDAYMKKRNK